MNWYVLLLDIKRQYNQTSIYTKNTMANNDTDQGFRYNK